MQVQLQDAFKADADATIDRMKDSMRQSGIDYTSIDRNDPARIEDADKIEITVKGIPLAKSAAFRGLVNDQFADWVLTALNSTDYKLNIKQSEALRLKADTLSQTIGTIERKINGLGLAETTVVPTGRSSAEAELLVEMPGVDDPAHVKQLLQTQAVLEWDEVKDPQVYSSQEEARAKHGGVLPLNTKLVPTAARGGQPKSGIWCRARRGERDRHPRCTATPGRRGSLGDQFRAHAGRRQAVRAIHGSQHRESRRHRRRQAW